LCGLGPATVKFILQVHEPIRVGHHGCALFNQDRQLVWARATDNVTLDRGEHELRYSFPMLPIRPGPYSWQVSLYDEGVELDAWECAPEMIVTTEGYQHAYDQWNGFLNVPSTFTIVR